MERVDCWEMHRHSFTGDWETARVWLSRYSQCKLGFTGLVTYSCSTELHKVMKHIPMDRFLLETDAPYFMKNSMNCSFPGHVIYTAQTAHFIIILLPLCFFNSSLRSSVLQVTSIFGKSYFLN